MGLERLRVLSFRDRGSLLVQFAWTEDWRAPGANPAVAKLIDRSSVGLKG